MPKFDVDVQGVTYEVDAPNENTAWAWANQTHNQSKQPTQQPTTLGQDITQGLGNLGAGVIRGAGSIGATILSPVDELARALNKGKPFNVGGYDIAGQDRRAAMDEGLRTMGAEPESALYKTGKIGAEIAGTAGTGGLLAKSLAGIPQAAKLAPLIEALKTSGMSSGTLKGASGLGVRSLGGALTGAASASTVNPNAAKEGAIIGAILPVGSAALSGGATLGKKLLGGTTGVGDEALTQAFRAGKEGGKTAEAFTGAMRGQSSMDDVLTMAKQNLEAMGQQKQAAYRAGMANIKADKTILDLSNIDNAVNDAMGMATYKGQVKNEAAADALSKIKSEIDTWRNLDPADFHTPEGLDALKQKIGGIVESIPFEQKTANSAANKVYNAIKSEINNQAPEYSKVMKGYSEATDTIKDIERALSLGQKASADTSMRKLQSLMRNNVNTSYGYRDKLAQQLQQAGGQDMMPTLAGQALSDILPRGIQRAATGTGGAGLAMTGNIPAALGLAAVSSPRLVGETMYGAGKAAGAVNPKLIELLRQGLYMGAPIGGAQ